VTAAALFKLAKSRGYYCPRFTRTALRKWLIQLVQDGLLEKRGSRFYLTPDGREVAACLAGEVVRAHNLAEAA